MSITAAMPSGFRSNVERMAPPRFPKRLGGKAPGAQCAKPVTLVMADIGWK
jgi:hypothetical protein